VFSAVTAVTQPSQLTPGLKGSVSLWQGDVISLNQLKGTGLLRVCSIVQIGPKWSQVSITKAMVVVWKRKFQKLLSRDDYVSENDGGKPYSREECARTDNGEKLEQQG
jgi:hypothetical protein